MCIHGYTPIDLVLESVLISIPKDLRGNMCTNENYRGIALCSALCKLVDLIIIDTYKSKLVTSELQYAFKTGHSTNMCTPVLKEVCSYYKNGNQARTQGGGGGKGALPPPPQKKKKTSQI